MGKYTQQLRNRLQGISMPNVSTGRLNKTEPTKFHFLPHRREVLEELEGLGGVKVKPVRPTADSTNLMNGEYFPQSEFPDDKGFWDGACNRGQCLRPGAKWYNFGSNAYYCQTCAHMLSHDSFNYKDSQRTWGPGKLLCEFQPTSEPLPSRTWLK